ncbi:MFS transporter [Nocardioides sp. Root1257]|uniref:MFS transporter n=1 Tax=unclassified Nocardioides TaxID=2615069 RepID=UPI0006F501C0|nr:MULTISPECIES: MFS transporter [unclassified Nocardioides]KQW49073.1 MFS transporter [Nocardioides sp. Root1257]KRC48247.1 MFS transporter [Nocardioides sp. Root224]
MTSALERRTDYRLTFLVLCVGVASFSLLQSMVNPVLPTIQAALHTDQATVTWVLTAYLVSASIFTPIIGRVGDKVGKERMLVVALGALAVGSLLAAVAGTIGVLIAARVIQGIGGGVLPLTFGIIRDEFPREKVASAIGMAAALLAVGGGVGLVIAGPLVDALSYHWLFWIPMAMTILAAIAAAVWVPESPERTPGRINVATAFLMSTWLVALLVGVSQGHHWGWTSGKVIGLFVVAAVMLPVWVIAEARSKEPLIDMQMMRIPTVWTVNLVALLFGMGMYAMFAFVPQFLQTPEVAGYGFGVSVSESGLLLLPQTVATFIGGIAAGRLAARFGSKALLVVGATLTAVGTFGMAFAHSELWMVIIETSILGLAFGLAFAAMSNLVVAAVPQSQTGVASGMNTNIRTVGGAIGSAVIATVVTSNLLPIGVPTESGYTHGFLLLAITSTAAAVVSVLVPVVKAATHVVPGPQAEAEHDAVATTTA